MCENCWDDHGRPTDWNANVQRALALIDDLYEEGDRAGPLHSVLENWNVSGFIDGSSPDDFSPKVMQIAADLAALFNEMPVRERAAALAYADGHVAVPASS